MRNEGRRIKTGVVRSGQLLVAANQLDTTGPVSIAGWKDNRSQIRERHCFNMDCAAKMYADPIRERQSGGRRTLPHLVCNLLLNGCRPQTSAALGASIDRQLPRQSTPLHPDPRRPRHKGRQRLPRFRNLMGGAMNGDASCCFTRLSRLHVVPVDIRVEFDILVVSRNYRKSRQESLPKPALGSQKRV